MISGYKGKVRKILKPYQHMNYKVFKKASVLEGYPLKTLGDNL